MNRGDLFAGELGFEAFGTSCGLAVVTGGLSVVRPAFDVLTVTLVALALAGWASRHRGAAAHPGPRPRHPVGYAVAFVLLGMAGLMFFDPPGPVVPLRALLLGLGVVPLWAVERRAGARRWTGPER